MIRTLFKHKVIQQKEFENVHGTNIRTMKDVSKLKSQVELHTAEIDPSKAQGKNGDVFINRISGDVFHKDNGIWLRSGT